MVDFTETDFHLETERLTIRNWREEDRDLFYLINSDDKVMEFFPFRRDKAASDKMMDDMRSDIMKDGFGYTALEIKETGESIGFCGLHYCKAEPIIPRESIEIGWRLAPQFWGKGYITEASFRLLEFGFNDLNLNEIISFAVKGNQNSFAVMERIGMHRDEVMDFDHPLVPDTHPHLKPHLFYSIENPNKKGG